MPTVQLVGTQDVIRKLVPERLYRPALRELLTTATLTGERVAREGAPTDTATLARSITSQVTPTLGRVFTPLAYARVMEEGRRPGSRPPPPRALEGWLRRHGIDQSLAFVVARAIGRRGIKGRFFMRAAAVAVQRALPGLARDAARRVEQAWGRG